MFFKSIIDMLIVSYILYILGPNITNSNRTTTTTTNSIKKIPKDLSGKWKCITSKNLNSVISILGKGYFKNNSFSIFKKTNNYQKITMNIPLLNIIQIQDDIIEIDSNNIYDIDGNMKELVRNGKKMHQSIYWKDDNLIIERIFPTENFSLIIKRRIDETKSNNNNIIMKQLDVTIVYKHLQIGQEIKANILYTYVKPSSKKTPISPSAQRQKI